MDLNVAAILSIMGGQAAPPVTLPPAGASKPRPMKNARMAILKLIAYRAQAGLPGLAGLDLPGIAVELALPMRSAKTHLQILFHAGMIRAQLHRVQARAIYELTPSGQKWADCDFMLTGRTLIHRKPRRPRGKQ